MTFEEEVMDLYRYQGCTDGQARERAKELLSRIRRESDLQIETLKKGKATFCVAHGRILCACEKCVEDMNQLNSEYRKALEEIAAMPDSDWQDRKHQCVAGQILGMPKCEFPDYCKVCYPNKKA